MAREDGSGPMLNLAAALRDAGMCPQSQPRIPSVAADSILGYFRLLPPGENGVIDPAADWLKQ
jgi:hypothetical protein